MELQSAFQEVSRIVQTESASFFATYRQSQIQSIDDPWAERIVVRLAEYADHSGKALRPLLVACGAAMSQQQSLTDVLEDARVRRLMVIVELNHKRLLMADDVADRDELRHGEPAFHVAMESWLSQKPEYAALSAEFRHHVARSYTEIAGIWLQQMVNWLFVHDQLFSLEELDTLFTIFQYRSYDCTATGWYTLFDQNFQSIDDADMHAFLNGLRLVTGEYTFTAPLLLGAALGAEFAAMRVPAERLGRSAGTLFQLTDDLIGLFGDPAVTGKPVGNDLREGKKTVMIQHAWQQASPEERATLESVLGQESITPDQVAQVQKIVRQHAGEQKAQQMVAEYVQSSLAAVQELPDHDEVRSLLETLVSMMSTRQK